MRVMRNCLVGGRWDLAFLGSPASQAQAYTSPSAQAFQGPASLGAAPAAGTGGVYNAPAAASALLQQGLQHSLQAGLPLLGCQI